MQTGMDSSHTACPEVSRDRDRFSGLMISGLNFVILLICSLLSQDGYSHYIHNQVKRSRGRRSSSSLLKAKPGKELLDFLLPSWETGQGEDWWEWIFLVTTCCHLFPSISIVMFGWNFKRRISLFMWLYKNSMVGSRCPEISIVYQLSFSTFLWDLLFKINL